MIDIGTSSVRAGYAGDDAPKAIIPTNYGYLPAQPDTDVEMTEEGGETPAQKSPFSQIFVGQHGPSIWREGMEIGNPLNDGLSACSSRLEGMATYCMASQGFQSYFSSYFACIQGCYAM